MKWQNNIFSPKSVSSTQMFSKKNYLIEPQDIEHKEIIIFHQSFQGIQKRQKQFSENSKNINEFQNDGKSITDMAELKVKIIKDLKIELRDRNIEVNSRWIKVELQNFISQLGNSGDTLQVELIK